MLVTKLTSVCWLSFLEIYEDMLCPMATQDPMGISP